MPIIKCTGNQTTRSGKMVLVSLCKVIENKRKKTRQQLSSIPPDDEISLIKIDQQSTIINNEGVKLTIMNESEGLSVNNDSVQITPYIFDQGLSVPDETELEKLING